MAIQVGALEASLSLNASSFISGMKQASTSLNQTSKSIQQQAGAMSNLANQVNTVTGTIGKFTSGLGKMKGALGAGLAAVGAYTILPGIFQAAKSAVIDFNQQVDQAEIALTSFLGSSTAAKKMLKDLQDFAAKTPFQFNELLGTTQSMMAMGVAAKDVLPRMRAIGDAAAAMGGSAETLQRIQRALGQIQAKGRVQAEELLQLAEAGIPAYKYLADAVGGTAEEMQSQLKKGAISSGIAINALLDGMASDFGGMMEAQSKTMMGALSTVKDYVQITVGAITRPLFETFRDTFVALAGFLSSPAMTNAAKQLADSLAGISIAMKRGLLTAAKMARPAVTQLFSAIAKLATVAFKLAKAIMPAATIIAGVFVGGLIAVATVITPVINGIASLVAFLGKFQVVVQTVGALLVTLWARNMYFATVANGTFAKSLLAMVGRLGVVGKAFNTSFLLMKSTGASTFASLKLGSAMAFTAIKAGAKAMATSLITSLGPIAAITAAIYIATKLFTAFSNRNKDLKERTNELTDKIKEQTDAMGGNTAAMSRYLTGFRALDNALTATSENGDKLNRSLTYVGLTQSDATKTLVDFRKNVVDAAKAIALQNGVSADTATIIANYVNGVDKSSEATMRSALSAKGLSASEIELALALEELNDQAENLDLNKVTKSQIEAVVAADKHSVALQKQAQDFITAQKAAGKKYTKDEEALALYEEFTRLYIDYQDAINKQNAALAKAPAILHNAAQAIDALAGAAKNGEVEAEAFAEALYGVSLSGINMARSNRDMRKSLGDLLAGVADTKGNFEGLTDQAYALQDMINANGAAITSMGGNSADVAVMMKSLIEQFTAAGKKAGYSDEKITELLTSLGILQGLDAISVKVTVDLEQAIKAMQTFAETMYAAGAFNMQQYESLSMKVVELKNSMKETGVFAGASYSAIKKGADGASGSTTTLKEVTEAYEKAVKDQAEAVDDAKRELLDYAKAAASAMRESVSLGSTFDIFKESQDAATEALAAYNEQQAEYTSNISDAVRGTLSLSDALAQQKASIDELNKARDVQATAEEKFASVSSNLEGILARQAELEQEIANTRGRRRKRELGEELAKIQSDAAKATEEFTSAQIELQKAIDGANDAGSKQITFLQGLEQQATKAKEFGAKLGQLAAAGLSKDAMNQVISAGADTGIAMAEELLTGGADAIAKANDYVKAIETSASEIGTKFADIIKGDSQYYKDAGNTVGMSFHESLMSQASKAREFSAKVKQLISMGLEGAALEEVMNAGIDAGTAIADQLISGGVTAIQQTMELQNALQQEAEALGIYAAPYFDQAGIKMAEALLNALQERLKDLPTILANATPTQLDAELTKLGKTIANKSKVPNLTKPVIAKPQMTTVLSQEQRDELDARRFAFRPFATGGIVTKPMLGLVGEAGPEAVIPLSAMATMGGGNNYSITVNAGMGTNGTQVGAQIVEAIKKYEKQNGKRWRS